MIRRNNAREGGCHFWPQGNSALPFVDKFVELAHDFIARFLLIEIELLEQRTVIFDEAVAPRGLAPFGEDIIPLRAVGGKEVGKTGKRLHSALGDN